MIRRSSNRNSSGLQPRPAVAWLDQLMEVRHPLGPTRPIWIRQHHAMRGGTEPQPSVPYPEWHPYCELNFNFRGRILQYVGSESTERHDGDIMLLGTGTPHYAFQLDYPQRTATVYFLPTMLLEMGPEGDGALLLSRCNSPQKMADWIIRPPPRLRRRIAMLFERMIDEFETPQSGSELQLRALLVEALVEIIRWEESVGKCVNFGDTSRNWLHVGKAIQYVHGHYMEPMYIQEIERAAGLNNARLQELFHSTLGMSCIQYLRTYRLSRAMALLTAPQARVTEVAYSVGFETLSHFNTSFRRLLAMSPTEYMQQINRNKR